jgi:hypothetical protein
MSAQRQPARTFAVDVTMGDGPVERARTTQGRPYIMAKGTTVRMADGSISKRTILSFGSGANDIAQKLIPGVPVRLEVRPNGGSYVAVGIAPVLKTAAPVAKPKAAKRRMSAAMLAACVDAGGFAEHAAFQA